MDAEQKLALVLCPECDYPMHKMGKVWSGRHRIQRYRCPKCGRTHVPPNQYQRVGEVAQ